MTLPRIGRFPITNGLVGDDRVERERQRAELEHQLDRIFSLLQTIVAAGGDVLGKGALCDLDPQAVAAAAFAGVSESVSRCDHVHPFSWTSLVLSQWVASDPAAATGDPLEWNLTDTPIATPIVLVNGVGQKQRTAAGPAMGYFDWSGTLLTFEKLPSTVRWIIAWYWKA